VLEESSVTVVVVTYNSSSVIAGCLDSLAEGMTGIADWQLVVVDNCSQDGTPDLVRAVSNKALILQTGTNGGYAKAINYAISAVRPKGYVLVLNPDTRMTPGCARTLVAASHSVKAGIAAPRLINENGTLAWSLRRDPSMLRQISETLLGGKLASKYNIGELITDEDRYRRAGPVDWATGAALLISAQCRQLVGEWDESFFLYSEETDYCQRARRAGLCVWYVADASVTHIGGDLASSPLLRRYLIRNKLRLFQRDHGMFSTFVYGAALATYEGLRAARGSRTHRAGLKEILRLRSRNRSSRRL